MDRRDFLSKVAIGLPLAGIGGASLLKTSTALAMPVTTNEPIYVAAQYGTGASDVAAAVAAASSTGAGLVFEAGLTFTLNPMFLIGPAMPSFIFAYGAILTGGSIRIQSPTTGFVFAGATLQGLVIDISDTSGATFSDLNIIPPNGFAGVTVQEPSSMNSFENISVTGGARGFFLMGAISYGAFLQNTFSNCNAINCSDYGWYISVVENSVFQNCSASNCGGPGWYINSANNLFQGCLSIGASNGGDGWDITGGFISGNNNTFVGCLSSGNSGIGFNISAGVTSTTMTGCQAINNSLGGFQTTSTAGTCYFGCSATTNGTPDKSFSLSSDTGMLIMGGTPTGSITGNAIGDQNIIFTRGAGVPFAYDPTFGLAAATLGTPAIADSGTPSGRTIRALPIYNPGGVLLGYAPLYANKW
jgi:hypothetical protein